MKKLIITICNRLGNQLFQKAVALTYAKKYNMELMFTIPKHNIFMSNKGHKNYYTKYNEIEYDIPYIEYDKIDKSFHIIKESDLQNPINLDEIFSNHDNILLYGLFQSDNYFNKNLILQEYQHIFNINSNNDNKTCISIRRGDFLKIPQVFIVPSLNWFIGNYEKYFPNSDLIVGSDDIQWCKQNIKIPNIDIQYIDQDPITNLKIM